MMRLVSLTPEGRVLLTLKHGKHTYGELRFEAGLSERWLTIKLKELEGRGLIEKSGRYYGLVGELEVSPYELALYMRLQARRMADDLAKLRPVEAVILFGGAARKAVHEDSDLDMIIVLNEPINGMRRAVLSEISRMELDYHIPIDPLILTEKDFLDNVYSDEGGIIYGVAEGFEVLLDKTGALTKILHEKAEDIKRTHEYLGEAGIWLRIK